MGGFYDFVTFEVSATDFGITKKWHVNPIGLNKISFTHRSDLLIFLKSARAALIECMVVIHLH